MTAAPLHLAPSFHQRMWGGSRLGPRFGYDVPAGRIGECWGISAHPNGPSVVLDGEHAGRPLEQVWQIDREFFGGDDRHGRFPLLAKFLDADDWLSVQVHPDDAQALELEGVPSGKDECWYVVAAEPGAELVLGHRASTHEELCALIDEGRWDDVLLRRPVTAGDFVNVPSGTVHAVGPGLLVYEVQQNCDTTYRVWDFDRRDDDGRARELHLDKAKRVLTAPYDAATTDTAGAPTDVAGGRRTTLVSGPCFEVTLHEVAGTGYSVRFPTYELCTVTGGTGSLRYGDQEHALAAGDHLVLPAGAGEIRLDGTLTLVSSRCLQEGGA